MSVDREREASNFGFCGPGLRRLLQRLVAQQCGWVDEAARRVANSEPDICKIYRIPMQGGARTLAWWWPQRHGPSHGEGREDEAVDVTGG